MAERISMTIAEELINKVRDRMKKENKTNLSEFIEERIREGMKEV